MRLSAKHKHIFFISALIITLALTSFYYKRKSDSPIHQLRIYQIPKSNQEVFHKRFKDHALRIMKKYNFHVVAIWESSYEDKLEFVYLIEWNDKETMTAAWEKFMADQEWKDIKAQTSKIHGTFVENIEDRTLTLTEYSPTKNLIEQ